MGKMVDFKCKYASYMGIDQAFAASLNLTLPDMYHRGADMAVYAKGVKERNGMLYCKLPFDTAVEGEALGAVLKYDESPLGPRKDGNLIKDAREILSLPQLDPSKGRIAEIFKACEQLQEKGEKVVIEIRGIFDIVNTLMDIQNMMMLWVMDQDSARKICSKIRKDLVLYFSAAKAHCDLFFYSDASGGLNVVGPKMGKQIVEWFSYPLMEELGEVLKGGPALQMCPKTAFMLLGCDKAEFRRYEIEGNRPRGEIYFELPDSIQFLGQSCNRELNKEVKGHIDYLKILRRESLK